MFLLFLSKNNNKITFRKSKKKKFSIQIYLQTRQRFRLEIDLTAERSHTKTTLKLYKLWKIKQIIYKQ